MDLRAAMVTKNADLIGLRAAITAKDAIMEGKDAVIAEKDAIIIAKDAEIVGLKRSMDLAEDLRAALAEERTDKRQRLLEKDDLLREANAKIAGFATLMGAPRV